MATPDEKIKNLNESIDILDKLTKSLQQNMYKLASLESLYRK